VYSAEEASTAIALTDLYSIYTGKGFFESQYGPRITRQEILDIQPFINNHFKFYRLSDQDLSVEGILSKAKEMVRQYGINGIVIDNMSTVEQSMSSKQDARHHQIQSMLMTISKFAKSHGVIVFLVAHPKKMQEVKSGIYRVPNGYDISDSAHWYNLTDYGITVYRNFETGQTEVHRWKVRLKYAGNVGVDAFNFTPFNSRYSLTERLNDGNDRTKFVGQPIDQKKIEGFARLADSSEGTLGAPKAGRTGIRIPS
jgi:twinkle protein